MPNTWTPLTELGIAIGMFAILLGVIIGTAWLIQTGRLITKATIEREAAQWNTRLTELRQSYEAMLEQERSNSERERAISEKYLTAWEREQKISDTHAESLDRLTNEVVKVTVFIDALRSVAESSHPHEH